jgi:hypothetical protein
MASILNLTDLDTDHLEPTNTGRTHLIPSTYETNNIPAMPIFSNQMPTMNDVFKTHPNPEAAKVSHPSSSLPISQPN